MIRRAIIDKNARIGRDVSIGMGKTPEDGDYGYYHVVDGDYVITKNACVPDGTGSFKAQYGERGLLDRIGASLSPSFTATLSSVPAAHFRKYPEPIAHVLSAGAIIKPDALFPMRMRFQAVSSSEPFSLQRKNTHPARPRHRVP